MLNNHVYNLMRQLIQEQTSLWRIKDEYMKDHEDCPACVELWKKLTVEKEARIQELIELVKTHL